MKSADAAQPTQTQVSEKPVGDTLIAALFPAGSAKNTLRAAYVASGLNRFGSRVKINDYAQTFVDTYRDELMRITDGGRVKYLGGGMVGDAYTFTGGDMKGMVLKMEPSWASIGSGAPHKTMQDRLWGSGTRAGVHPMIYDQGSIHMDKKGCEIPGGSIKWAVMERLEVFQGEDARFVSLFIERGCAVSIKEHKTVADAFTWGIGMYDPDPTGEKLASRTTEALEIAQRMRLNPTLVSVIKADGKTTVDVPKWCVDLFDAVSDAVADKDIKPDLHGGNIGLRRLSGTRVEWVFFD